MTNKRTRWSADEKVRIVLLTFDSQTTVADLCREHDLAPGTIYSCRKKFMDGGRRSFEGSDLSRRAKVYEKEIASLRRIAGEYAVAHAALKKVLEDDGG